MLNKENNYVEWVLLMVNLEDTQEHIANLIDELHDRGYIDEVDFKIQIAHIYGHLNRIYYSRNHIGEISSEQWQQYSRFPTDIEPI